MQRVCNSLVKNWRNIATEIGISRKEQELMELDKGYGLINITEPEIIKIHQFWQRKIF